MLRSVPRDIQKIRRETEGGPGMMRNEKTVGSPDGRPVASTRANLKAITVLGSFVNGGVRINCKSSGSLSRTRHDHTSLPLFSSTTFNVPVERYRDHAFVLVIALP